MMSDQNPLPGDIRHSQIPVGCPTPPPPRAFKFSTLIACANEAAVTD